MGEAGPETGLHYAPLSRIWHSWPRHVQRKSALCRAPFAGLSPDLGTLKSSGLPSDRRIRAPSLKRQRGYILNAHQKRPQMTTFDWEQEGYERLQQLEGEVAGLRREVSYLREYLEELEWEIWPPRRRQHDRAS